MNDPRAIDIDIGNMETTTPKLLWKHEDPTSTRIFAFKERIEQKFDLEIKDYEELRTWSISHINAFWEEVWLFTGIRASKPYTQVSSHGIWP